MPAVYPPYQHPLLDQTQHVTKPWQLFFLSLAGHDGASLDPGSVTFVTLEPIASPRLLGRGSSGTGPVEVITLGTGLTMTGTTLSATAGSGGGSEWSVLTTGDVTTPELIFAGGDVIMVHTP